MPAGYRPLAAVLAANVISVAGDSVTQLGVPWYVLESTGSSARAGVVAFCALFPVAVSAWASGPFIDRIGRRRVSIVSDLACGTSVAAIPLLQIGGVLHFWMLCGLMALAGLTGAPGSRLPAGCSFPRWPNAPACTWSGRRASRRGVPVREHAGRGPGRAPDHRHGGERCPAGGRRDVRRVGCADRVRAADPARRKSPVTGAAGRNSSPGIVRGKPRLPSGGAAAGGDLPDVARRAGAGPGWSSVLLPVDVRAKLGSVLDLGLLETVFAVCALAGHCCTVPWRIGGGGGRCSQWRS